MKKLKHYTAASLGLILFVSVIALSVPQSGHSALTPPDKDVRVINTATEAVPVTIQGTPSVQAQQSGPWNVGVSGSVQVGNSEAAPIYVRDVDRPTARPFLKEITLTLPAANNGENVSLGILVGELVVIEQVSALGTLPADQFVETMSIATRVPPDNVYHSHLLQFNKLELNPGTNMYTVPSQQVRIYAGPGSFARMSRVGNGTIATVRFVISGYYANE
jgi:hypothetical protein